MEYPHIKDSLKNLLNSYSADEEKLTSLYKTALENADKAHADAQNTLDAKYQSDRKRAYSDNLRDERNTMSMLAERGLGFSGEAAQTKLNSNILLSNRLGALESQKASDSTKLTLDHADKKHDLTLELLEKTGLLNDKRNQLGLDIAALEQKEADSIANRELEKELSEAERNWEKEKFASQQQADKEEKERERLWEKEKLLSQLQADKEKNDSDRLWEQQKQANEIQAEREALDKKLNAEKEMQEAELLAKYKDIVNASDKGNGNASNGSGNGKNEETEDELLNFTPDITPKDLAKLMVGNATDDNFIEDDKDEYLVNKYLLDMQSNYNLSDDYMKELIFMLKAYGYNDIGSDAMRVQVISYDASTYYDEKYEEYYNKYAMSGLGEGDTRQMARTYAMKDQMEYIRTRANSRDEFIKCCVNNGISYQVANNYALGFSWGGNVTGVTGGTGRVNTVVTRQIK